MLSSRKGKKGTLLAHQVRKWKFPWKSLEIGGGPNFSRKALPKFGKKIDNDTPQKRSERPRRRTEEQSNRGIERDEMKQRGITALALGLLLVAGVLPREADAALGAVLGFALPGWAGGNLADPDGDGRNIFGLNGLEGTIVSGLFNTHVTNAVVGAQRALRAPQGGPPPRAPQTQGMVLVEQARRYADERRAYEKVLGRANEVMEVLAQKQLECESDFADVCQEASFPTVDTHIFQASTLEDFDSSELECRCVPAVALEMAFGDQITGGFNETSLKFALAAKLGVNPRRVRVVDATFADGVFRAAVKILPNLKEYYETLESDEAVVAAFGGLQESQQVFHAEVLAVLESLLSSRYLEGYGGFDYTVRAPVEACTTEEYPLLCQ